MANWLSQTFSNLYSKPYRWAEGRIFGGGPPDSYGGEIKQAGEQAGAYGREGIDAYLKGATAFNPQAALREAAGGLFDQANRGLQTTLENTRGRNVGSGRLGTGYGSLDESAATYDATRDFGDKLSSMALQEQGLEQQNLAGLRQFGENEFGDYSSILGGLEDAETGRYNAKTQQRSGLFGSLAQLAGQYYGRKGG